MVTKASADEFIETWGTMGALWGINRSSARIQALLILSDQALDLDTIAKRLQISRGNASMSLKELRAWGVIHRVNVAGDRRDFFVAEGDIWTMLMRIAVERKKRELDPAFAALRKLLEQVKLESRGAAFGRLSQMAEIMTGVDALLARVLADVDRSRAGFELISSTFLKGA
jgi:DNA-binding transcriptional regulator GbsR (MarR family)